MARTGWRGLVRIELVSLVVSSALAVGIGVFGFWLASYIDSNGTARDEHEQCTNSVLDLRESLISLRRGYDVDQADRPNRLADWDEARFSTDQVIYTCKSSLEHNLALTKEFNEVRGRLENELLRAYQGHWTQGNTDLAIEWTGSALKYLSER